MRRRIRGHEPAIWVDGQDYRDELYSCHFVPTVVEEENMCDAPTETVVGWVMELEGFQSLEEGALWRVLWDRSGEDVAFVYAPHGNSEPSMTSPHFEGVLRVGARAPFGGEASVRSSHTFSSTMQVVQGPHLVTN